MNESLQHKLDRVRPPRVQITYDVEIGGAIEKKELPLVVGIMADLSGLNSGNVKILNALAKRKFIEIDRDNFTEVMAAQQPVLEIEAEDWLTKYELGMIRRIKALALLATSINKKSSEIFKLSGADTLLIDNVIPAISDNATIPVGILELRKTITEHGQLDDSVLAFMKAMAKFMTTYMPLHESFDEDFSSRVESTLIAIVNMVEAGEKSEAYLEALAALIPEKPDLKTFRFKFNSLDDFSPLSILKQDQELSAIAQKKQKLSDLLHKLDNNEDILNLAKKVIMGEATAVSAEEIAEVMPDATDFQKTYIASVFVELISDVDKKYITLAAYKADDDADFVFEMSFMINILIDRIADIDEHLSNQINAILHNKSFQKLEASWRGLNYLVKNTETGSRLKLRLLNVSQHELQNDLEKAIEFDQSQLFKKIYEAEYGTFGGHPYSLLLGDYEFGRSPQDIALLTMISGVAAAAHAPFISAAAPGLFDMNSFLELATPRALSGLFESVELIRWNSFRNTEDSRYVVLVLPHIMMRLPYGPDTVPVEGFDFTEDTDGGKHGNFLWANAAYAKAQRITDAFAKYSWCAAIRGMEGGGAVTDLPIYLYRSKSGDQAMVCPTEISITDRREKELSDLGFISLIHRKGEDLSVFFSGQTTQRAKVYDTPEASANARLSAVLPYLLASSRFAHYIKVLIRDKIGGFLTADNVQTYLNRWISDYVLSKDDAGQEVKAEYPLRDARIDVFEVPGKPGVYTAIVYLRPHFQLEELTTSIRLVAELPASAA